MQGPGIYTNSEADNYICVTVHQWPVQAEPSWQVRMFLHTPATRITLWLLGVFALDSGIWYSIPRTVPVSEWGIKFQ